MTITNCIHEKLGVCIPAGVQQCGSCPNFKLDTSKCENFGTNICMIKKECPCKNWERLKED